MRERHQWERAAGIGVLTFLTGLLIYDRPPELAAYWQPALQGAIAALGALGINLSIQRRG